MRTFEELNLPEVGEVRIMPNEKIFNVGDWVVKGERTMIVDEVRDDVLIVNVKTPFGYMKERHTASSVRPWTVDDAKRGQYLACDPPDGDKLVFISEGKDNPYHAIAGCNVYKDLMWVDEVCCLAYKEYVRPAFGLEINSLDEALEKQHLHFNLDRLELERIEDSCISVSNAKATAADDKWTLFRREAAKDILCAMFSAGAKILLSDDRIGETTVRNAIFFADELIRQLKEKEG